VARLHVRAQRSTPACDATDNTACTILTELGRAPSMTLAELSRRLRLDKGWVSRAVDRLVADGLIDKAGGADRRTIALSLTRAGRAEHRRLDTILDAQVTRVIDRIPSAERAGVMRALQFLHDAYVAELAGEPSAKAGALCTTA
jgi:DNA-binding MarR family transcriptional regulator